MNKIGWFGKFIFLCNSIAAVVLLLGYVLPYVPPSYFPRLSVLSLLLPVLIVINIVFFGYWLVRLKRKMLLSGLVLLLGFNHLTALLHFGSSNLPQSDGFRIMSYNVHSFTQDGSIPRSVTGPAMTAFIDEASPDILSLQEYNPSVSLAASYPYAYAKMTNTKQTFGQVIYSKYPIVDKGALDFPQSGNNIIYADIAIKSDTIRVYNIHFQSFKMSPSFSNLQQQDSKRLIGRMGDAFKKQESQLNLFLAHEQQSAYPVVIAGDFNNSAFSYIYRKAKGEKLDAFAKAGSGTGRTFMFDFLPLRIDFILSDPIFKVLNFKNYDLALSDHYPIMAQLAIRAKNTDLAKP
ncbi:MAG: endonuclease/exonuclease/phosphatase family protein [Dokdonia sp.]|jgi:endonuclease/exonuclease/phosphatase family metal-dependent hydrolase